MGANKQSVGIDVSKDHLEVMFKEQGSNGVVVKGSRSFENTLLGFERLLAWCIKRERGKETVYVLEATGVYHEDVLYFLYEKGKSVCLELPQVIKYYAKSKSVKTKTDKKDSSVIADYGLERVVRLWCPPCATFKRLRDLSREHTCLMLSKTVVENRLHAAHHAHEKERRVIERMEAQIAFYKSQVIEIEKDIQTTVAQDQALGQKLEKLTSIKGIGLMTVIKIIAETGGFYLFNNINQLVSYAGLDVIENQSGSHKGKSRISKKGNTRLRTALYMPALSAIRHDKKMNEFNARLMETHVYKKQAIVAVMRKLLILVYTLWKKEQAFDENYQWKKTESKSVAVKKEKAETSSATR